MQQLKVKKQTLFNYYYLPLCHAHLIICSKNPLNPEQKKFGIEWQSFMFRINC